MADEKTIDATLKLVYVPDTYTDTERQEGASWPLGSGHYNLVVVADGAQIHLHTFKAGAVDKQLALAKERQKEEQQSQTTPPPGSPPPPA